MLRRELLRTGAVVGTLGVAGCSRGGDEPTLSEGFEDGPDDWEASAAIGPEVDLSEFEWSVDATSEELFAGEQSLRVWNQGDSDDGVTWVSRRLEVESGQSYQVEASGQFRSESESFNTIRHAVMRLGPEPAAVEEDFPQLGVNSTEFGETPYGGLLEPLWLADDWREYTFEWTTPELTTDTLHFAVGTAVIWEADATHYVDDLSVTVEPQ